MTLAMTVRVMIMVINSSIGSDSEKHKQVSKLLIDDTI
jgi:hypothetical protein